MTISQMTINKADILERLNPADSFTLAMDEEIRKDGLAGNYGCFALELSDSPDVEVLQQRIAEFSQRFPVALASLQQIGKRYYWCKRISPPPLFFQHHCQEGHNETDFQRRTIDRIMNHKQAREIAAPIEFHLLTGAALHTFFIRWMHPFGDARGADLIIKYLCTDDAAQRQQFGLPKTPSLVAVQLGKYHWWQKLNLFLQGKRYISQLDSLPSIPPFTSQASPQRMNYRIQRLSVADTAQVSRQAKQHVGLTGTSLYYIGCLMRTLEKMSPDHPGAAYCAPYAFNLRKQRALAPMTGNHVSALFAQAPRSLVQDRLQLFAHLKQQNAKVIRQQIDYAFLPLMWAGSWLSLAEYGKILRLPHGSAKERSSFWFSDVGRLDIPKDHFPGAHITGVYHACQVTTPPGLALLCCIYQDQLILSYNFAEPTSNPEQIGQLHQLMLAELLGAAE